jgi:hypothetical protein
VRALACLAQWYDRLRPNCPRDVLELDGWCGARGVELVPQTPRDVIAREWGYEHDHPFADHARTFAQSGFPFYVCPDTHPSNVHC